MLWAKVPRNTSAYRCVPKSRAGSDQRRPAWEGETAGLAISAKTKVNLVFSVSYARFPRPRLSRKIPQNPEKPGIVPGRVSTPCGVDWPPGPTQEGKADLSKPRQETGTRAPRT